MPINMMDIQKAVVKKALRNGHLDIIMDLHEINKDLFIQSEDEYEDEDEHDDAYYYCKIAAFHGHLKCLKYLHENGCSWYACTCSNAAFNGHFECLKYAHENGCPWNEYTCADAARYGHIKCLKYAHKNGCPWDNWVCYWAAENGHLECIKYAHENGCPWDNWAYYQAVKKNHIECIKWFHENGCPCIKNFLSIIVKKILIPKWRAAVKSRQIVIYWMELGAQTSCAENGRARMEDKKLFENNFNNLLV